MVFFYLWASLKIILESLPISSSGHLFLFEKFLTFFFPGNYFFVGFEDLDFFFHIVSALIFLFFLRKRIFEIIRKFFVYDRETFILLRNIFVTDVITSILFFSLKAVGLSWFPLSLGFTITALFLFSLVFIGVGREKNINLKNSITLGFAQGLTVFPGISRFAVTFVFCRRFGMSARKSLEHSLLIIIPLFFAATVKAFLNTKFTLTIIRVLNIQTVCAMFASGIAGYFVLRWVANVAYSKKLWRFSIYFIIPIILSLVF